MRKIAIIGVLILVILSSGCEKKKDYWEEMDGLTHLLAELLPVMREDVKLLNQNPTLNEVEKEKIIARFETIIITCQKMMELKPPKEAETFHKLQTESCEEMIECMRNMQSFVKTENEDYWREALEHMEKANLKYTEATNEHMKIR